LNDLNDDDDDDDGGGSGGEGCDLIYNIQQGLATRFGLQQICSSACS
jgi:hypothetical protein